MYSLWQDLAHGTINFDLVTLTLKFDLLWKTLTLAITFKPEVIWLSYCTCVFLATRPFTWYHNFWPCDLDLELWPTFEKLYPWLLFSDGCRPASIVVFWQLLLTLWPWPWSLTYFWKPLTRSDRAFILHICIPCDNTFHMARNFWPPDLDLEVWPTFEKL